MQSYDFDKKQPVSKGLRVLNFVPLAAWSPTTGLCAAISVYSGRQPLKRREGVQTRSSGGVVFSCGWKVLTDPKMHTIGVQCVCHGLHSAWKLDRVSNELAVGVARLSPAVIDVHCRRIVATPKNIARQREMSSVDPSGPPQNEICKEIRAVHTVGVALACQVEMLQRAGSLFDI